MAVDELTGVGDFEIRAVLTGAGPEINPPAVEVMPHGILDKVAGEPLQERGIATHLHFVEVRGDTNPPLISLAGPLALPPSLSGPAEVVVQPQAVKLALYGYFRRFSIPIGGTHPA